MPSNVTVTAFVTQEWVIMKHCWNDTDRKKIVPLSLCPPQIPHGLLGLNLELRGDRQETNHPSHASANDGRSGEWRRRFLQNVSRFLPDSTELITRQNVFQSHDRQNQISHLLLFKAYFNIILPFSPSPPFCFCRLSDQISLCEVKICHCSFVRTSSTGASL